MRTRVGRCKFVWLLGPKNSGMWWHAFHNFLIDLFFLICCRKRRGVDECSCCHTVPETRGMLSHTETRWLMSVVEYEKIYFQTFNESSVCNNSFSKGKILWLQIVQLLNQINTLTDWIEGHCSSVCLLACLPACLPPASQPNRGEGMRGRNHDNNARGLGAERAR